MLLWIKDVQSRFSVLGGLNCRYMQLFNFRRKPYWAKCQISWLLPKIKHTSSFCYNVLKWVLRVFSCMLCKGSAFFSHSPIHLYIFTCGINNWTVIGRWQYLHLLYLFSKKCAHWFFASRHLSFTREKKVQKHWAAMFSQSAAVPLLNQSLKNKETATAQNQPEEAGKNTLIFYQMALRTL